MISYTNKRGFTLIELLTAIAIIGILIGLISPALRLSRKRAKTIACMNNLKEIGHMISLYEIDKQKAPQNFNDVKNFSTSKGIPAGMFQCPVTEQEYTWSNSAFDTANPLISHSGNNPHETNISLTGYLNVQRGDSAFPGSEDPTDDTKEPDGD